MNEAQATKILEGSILKDNSLHNLYNYFDWSIGETNIVLDGQFDIEELEAIAWWMRNKNN